MSHAFELLVLDHSFFFIHHFENSSDEINNTKKCTRLDLNPQPATPKSGLALGQHLYCANKK